MNYQSEKRSTWLLDAFGCFWCLGPFRGEELNIFKHDARCLEDYWHEAGEELVGEIYDRIDNRKKHTKTGMAFKTCFVLEDGKDKLVV